MTDTHPNDSQVRQRSKAATTIAREQIQDLVGLSNDAVFSGAWSWPIKVLRNLNLGFLRNLGLYTSNLQGLLHLLSRPSLLSPIKPLIIKSTILTLAITAVLFVVGYLPTVAVLAFSSGPLAFGAAIPVILGAGSAIGLSLSRIIWLSTAQEELFDQVSRCSSTIERFAGPTLSVPFVCFVPPNLADIMQVLVQEGLGVLVARGREIRPSHTGSKIGKLLTKPLDRFSKEAMVRLLISLPLNAIPVVGPAIFLLYNGAKAGPSYHNRYFQLKTMTTPLPGPSEAHLKESDSPSSPSQDRNSSAPMSSRTFNKNAWVKAHRGAYAGFGSMAMALDLIPGAVVVCMFGNVVGAALWASRIEKEGTVEGMADLKMEGRKEL